MSLFLYGISNALSRLLGCLDYRGLVKEEYLAIILG